MLPIILFLACDLVSPTPALAQPGKSIVAYSQAGEVTPVSVQFNAEKWNVRSLTNEQPLRLDQIRKFEFPKVEHAPANRRSLAESLLLSSGERLPAKLQTWNPKEARFTIFDAIEKNISSAILSSYRGPRDWELALPPNFAPDVWQLDFDGEISPTQNAESLVLPNQNGSIRCSIPTPFDTGIFELEFTLPTKRPAGINCMMDFGGQQLQVQLDGKETHFEVRLEQEGKSLPIAQQRLRRSGGRYLLCVEFSPKQWRATINQNVLGSGKLANKPKLQRLAVEVSVGEELTTEPATLSGFRLWRAAKPLPQNKLTNERAAISTQRHQQIFGTLEEVNLESALFHTPVSKLTIPSWQLRAIDWPRRHAPIRRLAGEWVELRGRSHATLWLDEDGFRLVGVLRELDRETLSLEHPYLGAVELPVDRIRHLKPLGKCERILLAPETFHLGDEVHPEWPVPLPDGTEFEIPFTLQTIPEGSISLVVNVEEMESLGTRLREPIKAGWLRTEVQCNGQKLGDLNTQTLAKTSEVRLKLDPNLLKIGKNRLRFVQTPISEKTQEYDDFLLRNVRLEVN